MVPKRKRCGALVLRLIVGLALLGWPQIGTAAGTWSVISLPEQPREVITPTALAADGAGNLYVADNGKARGRDNSYSAIQRRDAQGNWSIIATRGTGLGQIAYPTALTADEAGNLYVAELRYDYGNANDRIQKRDAQGNWSVIATAGTAVGQVNGPSGLALDAMGNLYVADTVGVGANPGRIQQRDAQGNWSVIATGGMDPSEGSFSSGAALVLDTAGTLYVAEHAPYGRIQKRDPRGNWSILATHGASALAVDMIGSLYVADYGDGNKNVTTTLETETGWLTRQYATTPKLPLRFYLEVGRFERFADLSTPPYLVDLRLENERFRDVLEAKGYPVTYEGINSDHSPLNWRYALPNGLMALAGAPPSP